MENIIIGTGPAGRLAGLELGKLGEKPLLIEKGHIAGNCLNEGCMVICAFSDIARFLKNKERYENLGLLKGEIEISYKTIVDKIKETQEIIRKIHQRENETYNNEIIFGEAKVENDTVCVNGESFQYENLLIATGSRPYIPEIKGKKYSITSRDLLNIKKIPKKLNIVGGGEIAIEIASIFESFGSEVSIITRSPLIKNMEKDLRKFIIEKLLNNIKIYENQNILEIKKDKLITTRKEFEGKTLLATGRIPNSEIVENLVELGKKGEIKVNQLMKTSNEKIYAAGDVTGGFNLTPIARIEGITAARNIAGISSSISYDNIPQGSTLDMNVGFIEKENKNNNNIDISMPGSGGPGSFWRVLSRDTGFSKISYNKKTKEIEGIYSISPSSVSDISYLSYLLKNPNIEDFSEEFIEIHPSTNVFQSILKEIY